MSDIIHIETMQRFETTINGHTAYLSYKIKDQDTLIYEHTIVPNALAGNGLGKTLVTQALDFARQQNKKVIPTCSFVKSFIDKNPTYQDLLG